jgi:hypothetical protein
MVFEKFMEIMSNNASDYYVISQLLKETIGDKSVEKWEETEIPDLMETFVVVRAFRDILENKINHPTKEETEFIVKHNIKDVLLTEEDLMKIQGYVMTVQEQKNILFSKHNLDFTLH